MKVQLMPFIVKEVFSDRGFLVGFWIFDLSQTGPAAWLSAQVYELSLYVSEEQEFLTLSYRWNTRGEDKWLAKAAQPPLEM